MEAGLYYAPYLAYRDNTRVIETLTPLVTLLINIDKLVKPANSTLSEVEDVADVFGLTPDFFVKYVNTLEHEMKKKKLLDKNDKKLQTAINDLKKKDVWLPFGFDNEKDGLQAEFNPAVERAIVAANYIIGQMQPSGQAVAATSAAATSASEMQQMQQMQQMAQMPQMPLVQLDRDSAQYLYVYDWTGQYMKAQPGGQLYNLSVLFCLTPRGMVNDLVMGVDFDINEVSVLSLNPANSKQLSFHLTRESNDHPRMTVTFANNAHTIPFNRDSGVTEPLHVYVPQNQQNVVIPISYHSDYVDVSLPSVTASQLHNRISIDPNKMIELFAEDMRNVHLHANLNIPECPMEQLVSARVNFARLTEPICSFLDTLFQSTEILDARMKKKYATKIPYIYTIDMSAMTCTKRQIMRHELQDNMPLVTIAEFEAYNQRSHLEEHLIRYTMFQMMLSYRKFTFDDFLTCPEHSITFDLYLRRGAGDVGYHYDLTPGNIVSSVGLLYSMPPDHVKVGPQLIPRKYRMDRRISDLNVIPIAPIITRNSAILFNNATYSHSTPNLDNFISRMPYEVGYEVKNTKHETIHHAKLHVTHIPIAVPESIKEKLKTSASNPSRTFLRSWHIVSISQEQMTNLAPPQPVVFSNGIPFHVMATETMTACFEWLRGSECMCIEVGMDADTGEIVPPTKLPGHMGGRILSAAVPNPQQLKVQLNPQQLKQLKQLKPQSKTQYSYRSKIASPIRASTLSISHLKQQIGSKLKKLRAVLKNPKKNFVVMSGRLNATQRRARSHSYTQYASKKRSHTRKVRSAV